MLVAQALGLHQRKGRLNPSHPGPECLEHGLAGMLNEITMPILERRPLHSPDFVCFAYVFRFQQPLFENGLITRFNFLEFNTSTKVTFRINDPATRLENSCTGRNSNHYRGSFGRGTSHFDIATV